MNRYDQEPLYLRVQNARWLNDLPERSQNEILFACVYATNFVHGTDGHHRLMIISSLAERLTDLEDRTVERLAGGEG